MTDIMWELVKTEHAVVRAAEEMIGNGGCIGRYGTVEPKIVEVAEGKWFAIKEAVFRLRAARQAGSQQSSWTRDEAFALMDEARADRDAFRADLKRAHDALRHISHSADTLSPQEFINNCASGLGIDRHEYAGECNPNSSLIDWLISWRVLSRTLAPIIAVFRDEKGTVTGDQYDAVVAAIADMSRIASSRALDREGDK